MPRCLDPGARFELVLESDKDKPEAERPTFVFRVLSMGEWLEQEGDDNKKFIDVAQDILKAAVVGWRNMVRDGQDVPFDKDMLVFLVDALEAVELLNKLQLSYSDKKKLSSPPTSTQDSSAPTATEASA